jgi:fructoselysine-6-P-deglycase FrlB-like protein
VKKDRRGVLKKTARAPRGGKSASRGAGQQTAQEILSQPATWVETARQFEQSAELNKAFVNLSPDEPWLFVACGSSYYLSRTIAAQWGKLLRVACTAVPASE